MVTQRAEIEGQNNIVVQIEGDNNAINLKGLAHLTLTRYLTRRRIDSDVDLLSPYSRAIPLIGRDRELADLRDWLTSGKPVSIRVLTGRAGSGKTRLALELCEQMLAEGWDAGFLESGELERFRAQQNLASWGWQRPTLIVSDYAAEHAERLNRWFQELADNQGDPQRPLRILLLERNAETGSGWWQTAFGRGGHGARAAQRLLDPTAPVPLAPIAGDERRRMIGEILEETGSDQRPPEEGADPAFDRQLAELTWGGEPLFLMMAGLMAKDIGVADVLSLRRTDLAFALAERELARIARIGKVNGIDPDFMEVMAAYATLCRGLDVAQIRASVSAEQAALGLPSAGDPGVVVKWLCDALPGADGAGPIVPDMIGEAAILSALPKYYDNSDAVVMRAFEQIGIPVGASVIRAAQDFVEAGYLEPLKWLDALIERCSLEVDQLMRIADALLTTSVALAEHGVRVNQRIAAILQDTVQRGEAPRLPDLAATLHTLAAFLSAAGRPHEALDSARQAVDHYRTLAKQAPDTHGPDLGRTLNTLAVRLGDVGENREALVVAQETVDLFHALAATEPDAYRPALAIALNTLAIRLGDVGQCREALAAAQKAVELFHALAATEPDAYRPALAVALNTLANRLSSVGRHLPALEAAQSAAGLSNSLAATAPDAYRPLLAVSHITLANRLREVGRHREAIEAAERACELQGELALTAPDAYQPGLAKYLMALADCFHAIGDLAAALKRNQEAIETLRQRFIAQPPLFQDLMVQMFHRYIERCMELGREPDMELLAPIVEVLQSHASGPDR